MSCISKEFSRADVIDVSIVVICVRKVEYVIEIGGCKVTTGVENGDWARKIKKCLSGVERYYIIFNDKKRLLSHHLVHLKLDGQVMSAWECDGAVSYFRRQMWIVF